MKKLFLSIILFILLINNISYSRNIAYKGQTKNVKTYESRTEAKDDGVLKVGSVKIDGFTYYFDAGKFDDYTNETDGDIDHIIGNNEVGNKVQKEKQVIYKSYKGKILSQEEINIIKKYEVNSIPIAGINYGDKIVIKFENILDFYKEAGDGTVFRWGNSFYNIKTFIYCYSYQSEEINNNKNSVDQWKNIRDTDNSQVFSN